PSIAVSLVGRDAFDFSAAAAFTRQLAIAVLRERLPADTLLNVNVPDRPADQIRGFALTRQGKRRYGEPIVGKGDPRGKKYYWIGGDQLDFVDAEGTDFCAVQSGLISVTPLHLDLTNYASLSQLQQLTVQWP